MINPIGCGAQVLCAQMGCGESKEAFYANKLQDELEGKLDHQPRRNVVKAEFNPPFALDPDTVIAFLRIGGAIVWYEPPKPRRVGNRTFRDKAYVFAKYVN